MVSAGIGHDQEAGLPESCLDLIGEGTGGEAAVERGGTGGRGKLQHSSLKWKERSIMVWPSIQFQLKYYCGSGHYQTPVMEQQFSWC